MQHVDTNQQQTKSGLIPIAPRSLDKPGSCYEIIADFFSKPLQGSKFLKFRNMILNIQDQVYDYFTLFYIVIITGVC